MPSRCSDEWGGLPLNGSRSLACASLGVRDRRDGECKAIQIPWNHHGWNSFPLSLFQCKKAKEPCLDKHCALSPGHCPLLLFLCVLQQPFPLLVPRSASLHTGLRSTMLKLSGRVQALPLPCPQEFTFSSLHTSLALFRAMIFQQCSWF